MALWSFVAVVICLCEVFLLPGLSTANLIDGFRPPSVPLIVVDPYFSVWSNDDYLYSDSTKHWTGTNASFSGMILIDGQPYRFMGLDPSLPSNTAQQTNLTVYPTQTVYTFQQDSIQLCVTFTTPSFPGNQTLGSYPVTFITYDVTAMDNHSHAVQIYYDNTAEITVASITEKVVWSREKATSPGYFIMRIGTEAQDYFGLYSDYINWGYLYVTVEDDGSAKTAMADTADTRKAFMNNTAFPSDSTTLPRSCNDSWPGLAVRWDLGKVEPNKTVSKRLVLAYDQVYSMKYFGTAMPPFWASQHNTMDMLTTVAMSYDSFRTSCDQLDETLIEELMKKTNSPQYTTIASLAWRQTIGGTIQVYNNITGGQWMFMKEISSDGDISTVDVLYPASPLFMYANVSALWSMLEPIMVYSINGTGSYGKLVPYSRAWAPHHLGHWPVADITTEKQEDMPIEETANMMIMINAIATSLNNSEMLEPYWDLLEIWGDYLALTLPDPGDQKCTDDFEGFSPHNVNLAAKGIVSLAAYANLLRMSNRTDRSLYVDKLSRLYMSYWIEYANDTDHFKRQYNLSSHSWSLKYNLLYQKVSKLDNLFSDTVFSEEASFYLGKMHQYGVPLDDRAVFTKTDWQMWVAAMEDDKTFTAITQAVYDFANETPDRIPFGDWYSTTSARHIKFRARPVIGGLFAKMIV